MSTKCDGNGTSCLTDITDDVTLEKIRPWEHVYSTSVINGVQMNYMFADVNIQTASSLQGMTRTFRDELHELFDSWRSIFGKFPWCHLAEEYHNNDNVTVLTEIIDKRLQDVRMKTFYLKNIASSKTNFYFSIRTKLKK